MIGIIVPPVAFAVALATGYAIGWLQLRLSANL